MRISKEPEERKQEILETAIKLFSVNGFEKTSISDIAKEIGIAQGLCYRYFPSKDVLFQSAINEYSNILVANMTKNINIKKDSLKDILRKMILFAEQEDDTYYPVFHNNQNKNFHNLLTLNVCEKLFPIVSEIIERANYTNEIQVNDVEMYASFCIYGQLGIILNTDISIKEKSSRIKAMGVGIGLKDRGVKHIFIDQWNPVLISALSIYFCTFLKIFSHYRANL